MITQFYYPLLQGETQGDKPMGFPKDIKIKVDHIDEVSISISAEGAGQTYEKALLKELVAGIRETPEGLIHNIAVNLALKGTDMSNDAAIIAALDGTRFKLFR